MNEVWRALGIRHNIAEKLLIMRHKVAMRWIIVVPEKNGMA